MILSIYFKIFDFFYIFVFQFILGNLDGPIKYPEHGKIASIRGPDGCMIGLFEPSEIYHRMMPK